MAAVVQAVNVPGKIKCPQCKPSLTATYNPDELKEHNGRFHQPREKNKTDSWKLPTPHEQSAVQRAMAKQNAKKFKTNKASVQATQARMARLDRIP